MIRKYVEAIRALEPLEGGIIYDIERWKEGFKNSAKLLDCVSSYNNKTITRKTIIKSFKDYYKDNDSNILKPFLLVMIWGYDNPNYGPSRTRNLLVDKKNLKLIEDSFSKMKDKKLDGAFDKLNEIKGLGVSYISKILYFAGRALSYSDYPLIFDSRAAKGCVAILSKDIANMLNIQPSSKFEHYIQYNNLLHGWAKEFNVEADQIEFFLFKLEF